MAEKGMYSSHGALVKKLPILGLTKWQKPKFGLINPLPNIAPRQKNITTSTTSQINLKSIKINPIFKFQDKTIFKPLEDDVLKPFLYIEQVMKKIKVQDLDWKNIKPFVTSKNSETFSNGAKTEKNQSLIQNQSQVPSGYPNIYSYEQDKRRTAKKLFTKLMQAEVTNLKDVYLIWNKKTNWKQNPQLFANESEFIQFIKELVNTSLSDNFLRHFFDLYKSKDGKAIQRKLKSTVKQQTRNASFSIPQNQEQKIDKLLPVGIGLLSINSLAFNYSKFLKAQVEIANIMSQKALKERYAWIKRYLSLFDENYKDLKKGMNLIKQYEESLRGYFKNMYQSYENPFEEEIGQLQKELQMPIIKYDKHKKDLIHQKIEELQQKNKSNFFNITAEYQTFIDNYETTIVKNHDLFFSKRTICKLILPILNKTIHLNKELLLKEIQLEQNKKTLYIECLSNLVLEIDRDKKFLDEDVFTLADLVELVFSKFKKNKTSPSKQLSAKLSSSKSDFYQDLGEDFVLKSIKKLIKQIKKQYLLKNSLFVQDINQFPADQQIPLQLLHLCFQMECSKVLVKNHIWSELANLIPDLNVQSQLHQQTISCNQCLGYIKKYFLKLDEKAQIQRNKSKQVCLLIQNVSLDSLWYYNSIVTKVNKKVDNYNQDEEEQEENQDQVIELGTGLDTELGTELHTKSKKLNFADVADAFIQRQNHRLINSPGNTPKHSQYTQEQNIVAKDILKAIFKDPSAESVKQDNKEKMHSEINFKGLAPNNKLNEIPEGLEALKTLSKSFIVPEKDPRLSTNAFDIRFYEKLKEKESQDQEILRLGTSALLSNLPKIDELNLPQNDPLKLSVFLEKNLTSMVEEQKKVLQNKTYNLTVKEGVNSNYFRDKIKLENRPTRYDSDGKSKYSVLFPVGYYEGLIANQPDHDNDRWYLRPHHVETLTQNPLSKKDNLIRTQYESKVQRISLKKRPEEFLIAQNVERKEILIQSLEQRIRNLKSNLEKTEKARLVKSDQGHKVPTSVLNKYLTGIAEGKEDKQLEMATYEAVLYDLRRNEKSLLVDFRDKKNQLDGEPEDKWWEKKDPEFNLELRKDRNLLKDSMKKGSPHKHYVQKLKNREIY